MEKKATNIHSIFDRLVSREEKEGLIKQKGVCFWLTGLSGSGKSTIAQGVERKLFEDGRMVQVLDGDNIRTGICNNLGFDPDDRVENIRRIAEVTKLFVNAGMITLNSFISPTLAIREKAQTIIGEADFHEIYISTDLAECERRDVKGLYKKARNGEIPNFTGIHQAYEAPENPAFVVDTVGNSIENSVDSLYNFISTHLAG